MTLLVVLASIVGIGIGWYIYQIVGAKLAYRRLQKLMKFYK